jgi:hypothetical protein
MTQTTALKVVDKQGAPHEVQLSVEVYKEAFDKGLTLPQYINQKYDTDAAKYGTAFQQLMTTAGLALHRDDMRGLPASRMVDVLDGGPMMGVVRPDGSQALTVAGRLLFPAVILQWIESELMSDWTTYEGVYNRMVALTSSADSPRVDQPIINLTGPRDSLAQPIAQGAQPAAMVSISLSDVSYRIPTKSIGFEISDEASKVTTIDLVGMTLQQQIIGQRIGLINQYLKAMVTGDSDMGISSLIAEDVSVYDSTITTAGTMTNKAWIKWLRKDWTKMTIDWVICDIDTYLAIENRTNRPTVFTDAGNDMRLTSIPTAANPGIPGAVNFFIVEPSVLGGGNKLIGIDSRKAIHKMIYVGGAYSAVEQYVMRRTTAMRFDFAEMSTRLMANGDGWKVLTLTPA